MYKTLALSVALLFAVASAQNATVNATVSNLPKGNATDYCT
jgi:hypothetical protein